jgi:hypothetical protein
VTGSLYTVGEALAALGPGAHGGPVTRASHGAG